MVKTIEKSKRVAKAKTRKAATKPRKTSKTTSSRAQKTNKRANLKMKTSAQDLPVGISVDQLVAQFPRLYHMAEAGSWSSIEQHGLLSTSALLDLFEVTGEKRRDIEERHRPNSVSLNHRVHGTAVVRDQKPMDDAGLIKALKGDATPKQWYQLLNGRVFFWLSRSRLDRLLNARAYRDKRQTILTVDTRALVEAHKDEILLCPINSGATKPNPHPRTRRSFLPLAEYPFELWCSKRPKNDTIVELTVARSVQRIKDFVLEVEEVGAGQPKTKLYSRP
jgi:hypothetical protein